MWNYSLLIRIIRKGDIEDIRIKKTLAFFAEKEEWKSLWSLADVLQREVENYHKLVKERRALGELDHPDDSVINLKNASHLVTDIWWDGDDVMGKVQVLDTPSGKVLKELAKAGVTLGISSRGLGSVKEERGDTIVEDDFQLICFDFVSEPSTTGAFMMKENKQPNIFTKADKINRLLNDILRD